MDKVDLKEFHKDFLKVQQELPIIEYNEAVNFGNVNFKYASLPSIHKIVKPILNSNNFLLSYHVKTDRIICSIYHISGAIHENEIEFKPLTDPKQTGSLITYYKRYLLSALLAIDTEDDKDAGTLKPEVKKKVALTAKAYQQVQDRIASGDKKAMTKCLAYFELTKEQEQTLLNLELEHNG